MRLLSRVTPKYFGDFSNRIIFPAHLTSSWMLASRLARWKLLLTVLVSFIFSHQLIKYLFRLVRSFVKVSLSELKEVPVVRSAMSSA